MMFNSNSTNTTFYNNFIKKVNNLEQIITYNTSYTKKNRNSEGSFLPYNSSIEILNRTKTDSLNTFLNSQIQKILDRYINPLINKIGIKQKIIIEKSNLGEKLDFIGNSGYIYNLLSDKNFSFNGLYKKNLTSTDSKKINVNNKAFLNKTAFTVLGIGGINTITYNHKNIAKIDKIIIQQGQLFPIADGGNLVLIGNTLIISTNNGYSIIQKTKKNGPIEVYVKASQNHLTKTFPDGLMGYKLKSGLIPLALKEINPRLFSIKFELPYLIPKYLEYN